ncbi:MAG: PstS family phosphate ABC transporter substrate-binding protein [Aphanothece sp. CMT-3BRIN-NPC111]|jgi:phosphate transport system substrate-binding protein|nr:PstS family phosphate ABC transporter substrate-binding protein [Aphanothece sp. CMT-3BRIN-NPC111]
MSQKNETTVLVLALLITVALIAGGYWWFTKRSGVDIGSLGKPNSNNSSSPAQNNQSTQPPQSTGENFAQLQNVPSGLFNYGGSTSWAPIRLAVDPAIQVARPEFRLRYVQPSGVAASSGAGIKMLIDGRLTFSQSSRPILDSEYQQAQQRGFSLQQIPIALDGLAVAVNPNLNIPGLTLEQLKSIYTGKTLNWKELGGPDVPIKPFSRPLQAGGTVELFVEEILGGSGQKFSSNVEFVPTTTQALSKLAGSLGGIYFASAPEVVPQCTVKPLPLGREAGKFVPPYQEPFVPLQNCPGKRNQLNIDAFQNGQYPITRNLFVVLKQNGQSDEQAGKAYANLLLTSQGQELISKAGFVKIR